MQLLRLYYGQLSKFTYLPTWSCRHPPDGNGRSDDQGLTAIKALKVPPAFNTEVAKFKIEVGGEVIKSRINVTEFSVAELQTATNSFSDE